MDKTIEHRNICDSIHKLYIKKNADYGDSFARLRKRYPNFVCMRIFDKLNRIETLMDPQHTQQVNDESLEDTLLDIANYCILEVLERRIESAKTPEKPILETPESMTASSKLTEKESARLRVLNALRSIHNRYHLVDHVGCKGLRCGDCPASLYGEKNCIFVDITQVLDKNQED